ncbi:hypothetical protein [Aestuariibaculum sediminum]|uniref:Uncharacterized protein n=1 Tax=Aestuariibaculum sediminum TaxID=2770637 RepID=A0A8J6QAL8_9FLAO|nr:hypothetical protein [Aestuariibaculum sediminum]MBD0832101.1 hypothetical protein [Aestuariibaculum sediminum]
MSTHFCKVARIKPNLDKLISLKELERKVENFVDDTSKLDYSQDLNGAF